MTRAGDGGIRVSGTRGAWLGTCGCSPPARWRIRTRAGAKLRSKAQRCSGDRDLSPELLGLTGPSNDGGHTEQAKSMETLGHSTHRPQRKAVQLHTESPAPGWVRGERNQLARAAG